MKVFRKIVVGKRRIFISQPMSNGNVRMLLVNSADICGEVVGSPLFSVERQVEMHCNGDVLNWVEIRLCEEGGFVSLLEMVDEGL